MGDGEVGDRDNCKKAIVITELLDGEHLNGQMCQV